MAAQLSQRERELVATNDRLTVMASIDMLSGLANRRGFQSRLDFEWMKAQQYDSELSLLMIDVDHFKLYNDTYGHPEGDACLSRLGETLAGIAADTMGFAGRYGGEEFCLLLPNTHAIRALEIGEMVRAAVVDLGVPHATSSHRTVTVSVGVACYAAERHTAARRPDRGRGRRPLRRQAPRPQHRGRAWLCEAGGRSRNRAGELKHDPKSASLETALTRGPLAIEFNFGDDPVAAGSLGQIKRAVTTIDQLRHRLAQLKLPDADRHRDAGKRFAGRAAGNLAFLDRFGEYARQPRCKRRDPRREARRSVSSPPYRAGRSISRTRSRSTFATRRST